MKPILSLLALGCTALAAGGQTCGPSFKEAHAFEVGDVFQVKIKKRRSGQQTRGSGSDTLWKYSITSKWIRGDTLLYARKVVKIWNGWSGGFPYPETFTHLGLVDYQDTVPYFSAADAGFDGCEGEIVPMPGLLLTDTTGFKARIRLATAPLAEYASAETGTRFKIFGGDSNLYFADGKTPVMLPLPGNYNFPWKSVYAEGLGMVHALTYLTGGNWGETWEWTLMGDVRKGDTSGTVETDDVFRARQVGIRHFGSAEGKGRDGGMFFRSGLQAFRPPGSPWFFDPSGRRLKPD